MIEVMNSNFCSRLLYNLSIIIFTLYPACVVFTVGATQTMSSANSYSSTSSWHMCDMDRCVLRTSLSPCNFGRRFYRCQHWSPVCIISIQHCTIFLCEFVNLLSCPSYIWYTFCCSTPISTRTDVLMIVKQPPLCKKGLQGQHMRQRPQEMRRMMPVQWKQKYGSGK